MSKKYQCTVLFSATKHAEVTANSPEEAADKAQEKAGWVSICHQCSDEIEVSDDSYGVIVCDEDYNELIDTSYDTAIINRLEAELASLRSELEAARGKVEVLTKPQEPVAYLAEHHAFRVSPHGQDAEGHDWLEMSDANDPKAFPVYATPSPLTRPTVPNVDWLSNVIRHADGNHSLGAGALAEAIVEAMRAAPHP